MVGLIPLFAVEVLEPACWRSCRTSAPRLRVGRWSTSRTSTSWSRARGAGHGRAAAAARVLDERPAAAVLARMLDEDGVPRPHGIRALSRYHPDHPYRFEWHGTSTEVRYLPAESDTGLFGGNSNWRGPVWFPVNYLLVEPLLRLHAYYGDDFTVECPTGSGQLLTLNEVPAEIWPPADARLFLRGPDGRRPVLRRHARVPGRPALARPAALPRVLPRRHRRGSGATHQTGWTGLAAVFPQLFAVLRPEDVAVRGLWGRPAEPADAPQGS